jgi:16S rRNA processing protein RimM
LWPLFSFAEEDNMNDDTIAIGKIVGAHGIKGEVVIQPYNPDSESEELFNGATDKHGKTYSVKIRGHKKQHIIVAVNQVTTRTEAEQLRGIELYVPRAKLPLLEEEEFYHSDLVGLKALHPDLTVYGSVSGVYNYGAGDIIEIELPSGAKEMFSFVKEVVPEVHMEEGYIIVVPPEVLSEREG